MMISFDRFLAGGFSLPFSPNFLVINLLLLFSCTSSTVAYKESRRREEEKVKGGKVAIFQNYYLLGSILVVVAWFNCSGWLILRRHARPHASTLVGLKSGSISGSKLLSMLLFEVVVWSSLYIYIYISGVLSWSESDWNLNALNRSSQVEVNRSSFIPLAGVWTFSRQIEINTSQIYSSRYNWFQKSASKQTRPLFRNLIIQFH